MNIKFNEKVPVIKYNHNVLKSPWVSVCVQTYQHVNYISDCLDGILMQKTKFPFEILLGEDESTDGTREICIDYAKKYPDKIKLFLHSRGNVTYINGKPTGQFNFLYNLTHANGKYIAICEGDDYWTDPYKLQKQVDFLEDNPDYGLIYTRVQVVDKDNKPIRESKYNCPSGDIFFELLKESFIVTPSVMLRSSLLKPLLNDIEKKNKWYVMDYWVWAQILMISKGKFLPDITTAYRSHDKGLMISSSDSIRVRLPLITQEIVLKRLDIESNKPLSVAQKVFLYSSLYRFILNRRTNYKLKKPAIKKVLQKPQYFFSFFIGLSGKISLKIKSAMVKIK